MLWGRVGWCQDQGVWLRFKVLGWLAPFCHRSEAQKLGFPKLGVQFLGSLDWEL